MPHAPDRHLPLLHRLEQGGLRLGRRAVDFVGQNHVARTAGPSRNRRSRAPVVRFSSMISVPGDVGRHQVGRELNATEGEIQRAGQRADHQRLGQSRHTFQQAMAAAEQADQQLFDHLVLSDNHLRQLAQDLLAGFTQFPDGGGFQVTAVRCVARHARFLVVVKACQDGDLLFVICYVTCYLLFVKCGVSRGGRRRLLRWTVLAPVRFSSTFTPAAQRRCQMGARLLTVWAATDPLGWGCFSTRDRPVHRTER